MIKINKIIPQTVEAFNNFEHSIGFLNEYEFNDLRIQICKNQQEGFYLIFDNKKIIIDKNGDCDKYPSGFFSLLDEQLALISKIRRSLHKTKKRFKIGDKLKALSFHKEEYNIDYVTITSINEENKVYHWEIKNPIGLGGTMQSGYFFYDSELYEENN